MRETGKQTQCIVLMHDSATTRTTAEALPDIIRWYTDNGYTFLTVADAAAGVMRLIATFQSSAPAVPRRMPAPPARASPCRR